MKLGSKITDNEKGEKKWLIPKDSYQREQILRVTRMAAAELLQYNIDVEKKSFEMYTTAVFYLKSALEYLNTKYEKDRDVDVSLGGLIEIGLSIREASDAEKIGNINGIVRLGPGGQYITENAMEFIQTKYEAGTKEFIHPETEDEFIDVQHIQSSVSRHLVSYELYFKPDDMGLYTMMMVFLKNAILYTIIRSAAKGSSIVNIGEMIAINGVLEGNKVTIKCDLGKDGKQIIKSDGATEDE